MVIAFIFAVSQRHILASMFKEAKGVFYLIAISMPLTRIATGDDVDWIECLFGQGGKTIEEMAIRDIVGRCDNQPKYVQELCYQLWTARRIGPAEINCFEKEIMEKRSAEFTHIWDSLSLNQKKAFKLVASDGGGPLFAAHIISRFRFKTASQVTAAIKFF